jgi:autotransporter family porin
MDKIQKPILITVLLTLTLLLGLNAVSAATWNVGSGPGNDSSSIAGAIAMANDGDIILVHETGSDYVENILVKKNLTLNADSTAVTIDGSGTSDTPVVRIKNGGDGTTINGFTITGANGDNGVGIVINNADNCFIINNIITMNEKQGIRVTGDSTDTTIKNNQIMDNGGNGIVVTEDADSTIIEGNTINGNGNNGIHVTGDAFQTGIMGNTIKENDLNGIKIDETAQNVDILSNTILNNGRNGIMALDNGWAITANYNRIYGHTDGTYFDVYVDVAEDHSTEVMDARYNWWGSNSDPSPQIYSDIEGGVLYSPWLYLTFVANPTTILAGSTSTLTASFNNLFTGSGTPTTFTPTGQWDHIPDGTPVTFTTTLGQVGSSVVDKFTVNGIATAILTANEGAGIAYLTAYLDALYLNPLTAAVTITPAPVSAASVAGTIGMQETGAPILPLILATLMVISGLFVPRKK